LKSRLRKVLLPELLELEPVRLRGQVRVLLREQAQALRRVPVRELLLWERMFRQVLRLQRHMKFHLR
jgi:hypothetical protein